MSANLQQAVTVALEQIERLPRHKRGITHSISFVISQAGIGHLASVGGR